MIDGELSSKERGLGDTQEPFWIGVDPESLDIPFALDANGHPIVEVAMDPVDEFLAAEEVPASVVWQETKAQRRIEANKRWRSQDMRSTNFGERRARREAERR